MSNHATTCTPTRRSTRQIRIEESCCATDAAIATAMAVTSRSSKRRSVRKPTKLPTEGILPPAQMSNRKKQKNRSNCSVPIVSTLTLKELRHCLKNPKLVKKSKQLFKIPSLVERQKVYADTEIALQHLEEQQMPTHNGRPWHCRVVLKECSYHTNSTKNKKKGGNGGGPLFRWYRGRLELANLPSLLEGVVRSAYYDAEEYETKFSANDLEMRRSCELSDLALEYDVAPVSFTTTWTSPLRESFRTRKSAMTHADELFRRDRLIDKVLFGCGARGVLIKPTRVARKLALEAGLYRFQRDGLWVVGQEEGWQATNHIEMQRREALGLNPSTGLPPKMATSYLRPVEDFVRSQRDLYRTRLNLTSKDGDVTKDMRSIWARMDKDERAKWKVNKREYVIPDNLIDESKKKECDTSTDVIPGKISPKVVSDVSSTSTNQSYTQALIDSDDSITNKPPKKSIKKKTKVASKSNVNDPIHRISQTCRIFYVQDDTWYAAKCTNYDKETNKYTFEYNKNLKEEIFIDDGKSAKKNGDFENLRKCIWDDEYGDVIKERQDWKLGSDQVEICYDVVMQHYEQVMHTVKARGLQFELRDGFDLLRERGRLRFDMEIPALNDSAYKFLSSPKAPWIEVVHTVLGKNNWELIHKGAFLSLPGAEAQVYHQDGPHLSDRYQKACHAVNVFIPLVDLSLRNGPTEFCLGTHILGKENYDKEFIDIPLATAGSPIIFDYRLGHRGLANTSSSPRPYIYLTYAAIILNSSASSSNTKNKPSDAPPVPNSTNIKATCENVTRTRNWKDDVNFSRKRYRKIGDLIDMPQSREERQRRRLEKQYEQLKEECRTVSEQEKEIIQEAVTSDDEEDLKLEHNKNTQESESKIANQPKDQAISPLSDDNIEGQLHDDPDEKLIVKFDDRRASIVKPEEESSTDNQALTKSATVKNADNHNQVLVESLTEKKALTKSSVVKDACNDNQMSIESSTENQAPTNSAAVKDAGNSNQVLVESLIEKQALTKSAAMTDACNQNQMPTQQYENKFANNDPNTIDARIHAAVMSGYHDPNRIANCSLHNSISKNGGPISTQAPLTFNNAMHGHYPYNYLYNASMISGATNLLPNNHTGIVNGCYPAHAYNYAYSDYLPNGLSHPQYSWPINPTLNGVLPTNTHSQKETLTDTKSKSNQKQKATE